MEQLRQYELEHILGKGGQGSVYLGYHIYTKHRVAVKFVDTHGHMDYALREIKLISNLDHPNIVKIYDHFPMDGDVNGRDFNLVIIMEYIEGEDMLKFSKASERERVKYAWLYARQLTGAMAYMHDNCVIHRDIKPENIMVNKERAVIVDFGLGCKDCNSQNTACGTCDASVKCSSKSTSGTTSFFSPQKARTASLKQSTYNLKKDDVWSLGLSILELYNGSYPIKSNIEDIEYVPISRNVPMVDAEVLEQMLNVDEDARISALGAFIRLTR